MEIEEKISALTKQLYPKGRAFKMPPLGGLEQLHEAVAVMQVDAYTDAVSILDDLLPDNDNFLEDDCTAWEIRLGMIVSTATVADRKAAILRKLRAPGANPAKGHYLYLQEQLQLAGFNVFVYENLSALSAYDVAYTISPTAAATLLTEIQHGDIEHGDAQHGFRYNNLVANNIEEARDAFFDLGGQLRGTFFIGGNPLGSFANVPIVRKAEFRQLILKLKRCQTVAFLFVHYV